MRYLPHTPNEISQMLETIGAPGIDSLFQSIPDPLRLKRPLNLPPSLSEMEIRELLRTLSRENAHGEEWATFLGAGSYSHYIPSAVSGLISRGEFLTAYTPYQPEISQGTLQSIFEYQTMVSEILGLEVANASHYDGSTATAEAALMAIEITGRQKVLVARNLHPEYRQVLGTYLQEGGGTLVEIPFTPEGILDRGSLRRLLDSETACVIGATPNFFGIIEDLSDIAEQCHKVGALFVTATTEPLAFGLFKSPGEIGADIAAAEGQSFGNTISFGGPGLGLFATKKASVRSLPGRLVGETVDQEGRRGFVLTLATREQHIRREKATSNICTNVALCALAATITLALWGKEGFEKLSALNFERATDLKEKLGRLPGVRPFSSQTTFNEFVLLFPGASRLLQELLKKKIIGGIALGRWYPELENGLLISVTEMNTEEQRERLIEELRRLL